MVGIVSYIYTRLALLSPRIEVRLRKFYWNNSRKLSKYNPNRTKSEVHMQIENIVDFDTIIAQLKDWGVKEGALLVVHSSYDELKYTGLSPFEIIEKLRKLIGETGTLAMPVIRQYKEEPPTNKRLSFDFSQLECIYNPQRTPVTSGILPCVLMRIPGAEISKHPLNPMCAIGPLAKAMMAHNIEGEEPSPHGVNSSWKFCLDHQALVCALGTDLRHHNTMGHVAEEAYDDWYWSDIEWYNKRKFIIESKGEDPIRMLVRERKPKWGMLHQAEVNRYRDLLKNGVIKSSKIGTVLIEFEESHKLVSYLRSKNQNGYPYFE